MDIEKLYEVYLQSSGITTDSRKVDSGQLFFALKGGNFNGNEFAAKAIDLGAGFAVIDEVDYFGGNQFILVEDVLATLQKLATYHRRQFDIPVIGITGTNGKTTTKELVSAVLSSHFKTHFTKGNFNNHIGVPLTLLNMPLDTEIAVIEMGANHIGEIDMLCRIAEPAHGLITNIGKAHLEGFGSLEGVKQTKSEMYRFLASTQGKIFVNKDEKYLWDLLPDNAVTLPYFNGQPSKLIASQPNVTFEFGGQLVQSNLPGKYNYNNIITAIAIGQHFGVPDEKIILAIENYIPKNNRSQVIKKETNTFILDAYNANPTSMQNALEHFSTINTEKDKMVILGDMLEMGDVSQEEHEGIVELCSALNFNKIILVGSEFEKIANTENIHFNNVTELREWFSKQNFNNTYFLIKGSRGIRLEKLLE